MARLLFAAIASLDGYVADGEGRFDWGVPDAEAHQFVNDLMRPVGTYLYGRRLYEVMAAWETMPTGPDEPAAMRDFAQVWQAADKVVYSRTLTTVSTARTRLQGSFDVDAVRDLKDRSTHDLTVGGPHLAAHAMRAGLVDEVQLMLAPVVVGGGTRALPDDVRLDLALVDVRRFDSGMVNLSYRPR